MADPNKTCTKCSGVLDREGSPAYCKKCWAEYQRNYKGTKEEMAEGRGFAAGVAAFREQAALQFAGAWGSAGGNGYEIAAVLRQMPAPPRD